MKLSKSIVLAALAAALLFPVGAFAAKGDAKKKGQTSAQTFDTVDANKDGVVTLEEYLGVMKPVLGEETAKARFSGMDKNSDGKLSKEEFASGSADTPKKRKKKNAT